MTPKLSSSHHDGNPVDHEDRKSLHVCSKIGVMLIVPFNCKVLCNMSMLHTFKLVAKISVTSAEMLP
jgi:hypothetical protein